MKYVKFVEFIEIKVDQNSFRNKKSDHPYFFSLFPSTSD